MSYSLAKAKHDARAAGGVDRDAGLMCAAHGCPNLWCVDAGNGQLCSAHAWSDPSRWPEITQVQQWNETERARMRGQDPAPSTSRRTTDPQRLRVLLRRYADHVRAREQDPKRWARKLRAREEATPELVNDTQRAMWRAALLPELNRQRVQAEDAAAEASA
jgi:hypothetical protein